MFSRIGAAAYKADLSNTIRLCDALGNPQHDFKSVHIAGTNGKGSTSHMLAAIFQSAGYKTGLYTSPHLKDFRERIKIDGQFIPESVVIDVVEKLKPLVEEIQPSFFEITVALAFYYFAQQKADIAIVEVGLGGRLDSTNIILPELSVITNIGWDHMNILGDSLEKIAGEKAGIIKKQIPVVIGEVLPETKAVFEQKALECDAPMIVATDKLYVSDWSQAHHELVIDVSDKHTSERKTYHLDLQGIYQLKNILTVLESVKQLQLKGWKINSNAIAAGLQHVRKLTGLHGRWEVIQQHPMVVLDVGHNEDGIRQLMEQVEITDHDALHIVMGVVKDKEIEKVLSLLPTHAQYYFTKAQIPRALPEEQLAEKAIQHQLKGAHYPDVNTALRAALDRADNNDLVLVCGSVFVVGEVIPLA